jgi:transcriptional regulator with XRE-family HTH domain
MDANRFGARLRELREQHGLSQKELADRAGLGQRTVSNWEQGSREPVWSNVVSLCQALGVSCEEFLQAPADRAPQGRGRPPKAADQEQEQAPVRPQGRPRKDSAGPSGEKTTRPRKRT